MLVSPLVEDLLVASIPREFIDRINYFCNESLSEIKHGNYPHWKSLVDKLERLALKSNPRIEQGAVVVGEGQILSPAEHDELVATLKGFHPWRKGPWKVNDIYIDTEWHSDYKWDRVLPHLSLLSGRRILDIGCGNGYHCARMSLEGARLVVGIDPYLLSVMQWQALSTFSTMVNTVVIPMGVDDIPENLSCFETVFSMGLLYHRRNMLEHIQKIFGTLVSGGEAVLETLIIDKEGIGSFVPSDRYAKMRNVWNIPTPELVLTLMREAGFVDVVCCDICVTSTEEQRSTSWMTYESLPDFLDPVDTTKTVEGHPAPCRAVFLGKRP